MKYSKAIGLSLEDALDGNAEAASCSICDEVFRRYPPDGALYTNPGQRCRAACPVSEEVLIVLLGRIKVGEAPQKYPECPGVRWEIAMKGKHAKRCEIALRELILNLEAQGD